MRSWQADLGADNEKNRPLTFRLHAHTYKSTCRESFSTARIKPIRLLYRTRHKTDIFFYFFYVTLSDVALGLCLEPESTRGSPKETQNRARAEDSWWPYMAVWGLQQRARALSWQPSRALGLLPLPGGASQPRQPIACPECAALLAFPSFYTHSRLFLFVSASFSLSPFVQKKKKRKDNEEITPVSLDVKTSCWITAKRPREKPQPPLPLLLPERTSPSYGAATFYSTVLSFVCKEAILRQENSRGKTNWASVAYTVPIIRSLWTKGSSEIYKISSPKDSCARLRLGLHVFEY